MVEKKNPWKCHFQDSKFQNVPRCLSPQELVPLVQVPKLPTIHYLLALKNLLTALSDHQHSLFGWLLTGGSTVEPTCKQLNGKNKGFQVSIFNHTLQY